MAKQAKDPAGGGTAELMAGIDTMIQEGRVDELEQLLDTLAEAEPADAEADDPETRTYARGLRDGLAIARRMPQAG